jgi:hypothetical protein
LTHINRRSGPHLIWVSGVRALESVKVSSIAIAFDPGHPAPI